MDELFAAEARISGIENTPPLRMTDDGSAVVANGRIVALSGEATTDDDDGVTSAGWTIKEKPTNGKKKTGASKRNGNSSRITPTQTAGSEPMVPPGAPQKKKTRKTVVIDEQESFVPPALQRQAAVYIPQPKLEEAQEVEQENEDEAPAPHPEYIAADGSGRMRNMDANNKKEPFRCEPCGKVMYTEDYCRILLYYYCNVLLERSSVLLKRYGSGSVTSIVPLT